ncbi:MAG TPA: FG-GAP repeat protein [Herpetosiphonaceae bacterium]|nr:FG-GAP repeat protein [Herpetosiphonaceae bacterium]
MTRLSGSPDRGSLYVVSRLLLIGLMIAIGAGAPALRVQARSMPAPAGLSAGDWAAIRSRLPEALAAETYVKASNTGESDLFGVAIDADGDTVVVGAAREDGGSNGVNGEQNNDGAQDSGAAYVFVRSGAAWTQQAYLKPSNTDPGDDFGWSVAISGDTIVVGAPYEDGGSNGVGGEQNNAISDAGAAYVFVRSDAQGAPAWTQQAYLKASNPGQQDFFGFAVDITGDTILAGAPWENSAARGVDGNQADNSAAHSGAAYVFVRASGVWSQQAYLKASNTDALDSFGASVAIDGDAAVIGAWREGSATTGVNGKEDDNTAENAGAAYVFARSEAGWSQQAYLKASNAESADYFGSQVAIDGATVVVGAGGEDSAATDVNGAEGDNTAENAGAAYVFARSEAGWSQQAYLKASNTDAEDDFGSAVAISGDRIVVAAGAEDSAARTVNGNQADDSALNAGAAYAFVRSETGWSRAAYLKAPNAERADGLGRAVALTDEIIAIGAIGEASAATGLNGDQHDNNAFRAGAAYVFSNQADPNLPNKLYLPLIQAAPARR